MNMVLPKEIAKLLKMATHQQAKVRKQVVSCVKDLIRVCSDEEIVGLIYAFGCLAEEQSLILSELRRINPL